MDSRANKEVCTSVCIASVMCMRRSWLVIGTLNFCNIRANSRFAQNFDHDGEMAAANQKALVQNANVALYIFRGMCDRIHVIPIHELPNKESKDALHTCVVRDSGGAGLCAMFSVRFFASRDVFSRRLLSKS